MYLSMVSALAAWLALPGVREWARNRLSRAARVEPAGPRGTPSGRPVFTSWLAPVKPEYRDWSAIITSATWWVPAVVLVAAPAIALLLRQTHAYDGYDHTVSREANPQIAVLLEGEQLAPPAPLPPELFMTREIERLRPTIGTASRRWELLDAEFRNRLLAVYRLMRDEHGYEMVLLEGYRSPERQTELATLGTNVTHAAAGESYHQYGLAADSAFVIEGRIVISEQDPRAARGYALYGAAAQAAGLVWGGSWRSLKDLGHVELRRPGVLRGAARMPTSP